jgi:predicted esterase
VLLHGDGETAAGMLEAWGPAAAARGILVFAPTCPLSEGCTSQSWWKWNGEPSWLLRQIDALAETRAIDRERMWIGGWSGGGTYIGWNTQELERTFAALVIHGGGVRPKRSACADPKAGVYFLGGDQNPLHSLTEPLHDYYVRCAHEDLTWTVLKGVDHQGERRALATRIGGILDWLETKRATVPVVPPALPEAGAPPAVAPSTSADPGTPPPSETPSRPPALPSSSCRCAAAGAGREPGEGAGCGAALLAAALVKRRRQGSRRRTPFTR